METVSGLSSFLQILESGATELKGKGSFTVELSPQDVEQTMRQVVAQSEEAMKKREVKARIDRLKVQIANNVGEVDTDITASKKVLWGWPEVGVTAKFGIENVVNASQQPTGRLRTTHLEVVPETLFGIFTPRDSLAPYVEGENINGSFKSVLDAEMQKRGARISSLNLAFTPQNTLKVEVNGSRK